MRRDDLFKRFPPLGAISADPIPSYWARGPEDRVLQVHLLRVQDPEALRLVDLLQRAREFPPEGLVEVVELEEETAVVTRALASGVSFPEWLERSAGPLVGPPASAPLAESETGSDTGSDYSAYFRIPVAEGAGPLTESGGIESEPELVGAEPAASGPTDVPDEPAPLPDEPAPLRGEPATFADQPRVVLPDSVIEGPPDAEPDAVAGAPPPSDEEPPPAAEESWPTAPGGGSDYTAFFGLPALGDTPGEVQPPPHAPAADPPPTMPRPGSPPPPGASPLRPSISPVPGAPASPPTTASPLPPPAGPLPPPPRDPEPAAPDGPDYTREFGFAGARSEPGHRPPREPEREDSRTPWHRVPPEPEHRSPPPGFVEMREGGVAPTAPGERVGEGDRGGQDSDSITAEFRKPRVTPRSEPTAPEPRGWNPPSAGRAPQALPLRDYLGRLDRTGDGQSGVRQVPQDPPSWKAVSPLMGPSMPGTSEPTVMSPLRPPEGPRPGPPSASPPFSPQSAAKGNRPGGLRTRDIVILVSLVGIAVMMAVAAVLFFVLRGD